MAALSEQELRRITGSSTPMDETIAPAVDLARRQRERADSLEDRKFTAVAAMLIGIALFASAIYTASGTGFYIQTAVSVLLFGAGLAWYIVVRRGLSEARSSTEQP